MMNLKNIISITTMMLICGLLHAQTGSFSIGPRVGLNYSSVNIDNTESTTGLVIGLTSTYSIREKSGITVDLLYSQEGFSSENNVDTQLDYIHLPVYYSLFFNELGDALRPKVYAGIVPGYLIGAESEGGDIDDITNAFHFGLSGGLGLNYRLSGRIWLNLDVRAYLGLTDVFEDEAFGNEENTRNQNVQVSLGIAYGLSKL